MSTATGVLASDDVIDEVSGAFSFDHGLFFDQGVGWCVSQLLLFGFVTQGQLVLLHGEANK